MPQPTAHLVLGGGAVHTPAQGGCRPKVSPLLANVVRTDDKERGCVEEGHGCSLFSVVGADDKECGCEEGRTLKGSCGDHARGTPAVVVASSMCHAMACHAMPCHAWPPHAGLYNHK